MPRGSRAACCISHTLSTTTATTSPAIWIPDALLADAFHRFASRSTRHGSSVPGPLEARRRAAKRRNTSLAHASLGGGPPLDGALLLGSSMQPGWWQSPSAAAMKSPPPPPPPLSRPPPSRLLLPSWLFQHPNPSPSDPQTIEFFAHPPRMTPQEATAPAVPDDAGPLGLAELQRCTTLDQIRQMIARRGIGYRMSSPGSAGAVFEHILQAGFSVDDLADFLSDPIFNPPGSSHHHRLLCRLRQHPVERCAWRKICRAFCRATEMGLVSVQSLQDMMLLAGSIELQSTDGFTVANANRARDKKDSLVRHLLRAVHRSKVLSLAEFPQDFLRTLFRNTASRQWTESTPSVLWLLAPWAEPQDSRTVCRLINLSLRGKSRMGPAESASHSNGANLASRVETVPTSTLQPILVSVTESLLPRRADTAADVVPLRRWREVLRQLQQRTNTSATDSGNEPSHPLQGGHGADHQLLVTLCEMLTRCHPGPKSEHGFRQQDIPAWFRTSVEAPSTNLAPDLFERLLHNLHGFSLHSKLVLLQTLSDSFHSHDGLSKQISVLLEDVTALWGRDFRRMEDSQFYLRARENHSDALIELSESINDFLPAFSRLSHEMIHTNKLTFKILTRVLRHNHALKIALSRSSMEDARSPGGLPEESSGIDARAALSKTTSALSASGSTNRQRSERIPSPQEAVSVLNHLAMSFSTAPFLSPRSAFRKVYWVYCFLNRYRAPIHPEITRALWHAGVARSKEHGVAVRLLAWVLSLVERVEGRHVKEKLIWSAKFRHERKALLMQEMERVKVPREVSRKVTGLRASFLDAGASGSKSLARVAKASDAAIGALPSLPGRRPPHGQHRAIPPYQPVEKSACGPNPLTGTSYDRSAASCSDPEKKALGVIRRRAARRNREFPQMAWSSTKRQRKG